MARPQLDRVAQERELDPPPDRLGEPELGGDRDAAGEREGAVGLDDPERDEQAGDRRAVVEAADRVGDPADRLGSVDRVVADRAALDEARDEAALRAQEGRHLGPDPDASRRDSGGMLHLAADAQEVRVVAGEADDVALGCPFHVHEEVAVRDPARERRERQAAAGQLGHGLERAVELVLQRHLHMMTAHMVTARRSLAAPSVCSQPGAQPIVASPVATSAGTTSSRAVWRERT